MKAGAIALGSLAASGIALGGAIYWLAPSSDLGPTLAAATGGFALFLGLVVLLGFSMNAVTQRIPWLGRNADVLVAVTYTALGVWEFHKDHGALLVAGVLLILMVVAARRPAGREYLLRAKPVVTGIALVIALVASMEHQSWLVFPAMGFFWTMTAFLPRAAPATTSSASA